MANPFAKLWNYMMALFDSKIEENADPKVQIQQAIEDAQRQHQELSQQAAAVIGNQASRDAPQPSARLIGSSRAHPPGAAAGRQGPRRATRPGP